MVDYTNKRIKHCIKMIKIKHTHAKGYYVFQGRASGNSSFIEDLAEAKQFIILANYYLKGYLKIHEYLLSQDGWVFIVRIHSLESIREKIESNEKNQLTDDQVWRIISERMRILLSTFVKFTNKKQGRTGSKVHSSYERFIFETLTEAKLYINKLRNGMIKLHQDNRKYRAKKSHYKIPRKLGRGSVFISSRKLVSRIKQCKERLEALEICRVSNHVLHTLIKTTLTLGEMPFKEQKTYKT